jgi:hypothetical protein
MIFPSAWYFPLKTSRRGRRFRADAVHLAPQAGLDAGGLAAWVWGCGPSEIEVVSRPFQAAAPPASSAARLRPRPARFAPPYSTMQVAAGIAAVVAVVIAHR